MVKLMALYSPPPNPADFDRHYRQVHMPLAAKIPGLRRMEINKVTGSPGGAARYYQIASLYFDDAAALGAALRSPEGQVAAADVQRFASELIHLVIAEVEEC